MDEKPIPVKDEFRLEPEFLGKLLFTDDEVELMLTECPIGLKNQVLKGQLITQAEIRHTIIRQAKAGSAEAQKMTEKWMQRIRINALD
jgi:hypothetical protein